MCWHEVIVAHARKVRLIGESRRKDNPLDAQILARLARTQSFFEHFLEVSFSIATGLCTKNPLHPFQGVA